MGNVLVELCYLHIFERKLVVKHAMRLLVKQPHIMIDGIVGKCSVTHFIVKQCHNIHMLKPEVPLGTLLGLLTYRECSIIQRTVLKIGLVGILHLHDKLLALLVLAIHIKDGLALRIYITHVFAVKKGHILYHLFPIKQRVQKVNK